jgi:hypothetical protein
MQPDIKHLVVCKKVMECDYTCTIDHPWWLSPAWYCEAISLVPVVLSLYYNKSSSVSFSQTRVSS